MNKELNHPATDPKSIFSIQGEDSFHRLALDIFRYQWQNNAVYRQFAGQFCSSPWQVKHYREIPFLPVEFFRSHDVLCQSGKVEKVFLSSGTTGTLRSRHLVSDLNIYRNSLRIGFEKFYGPLKGKQIIALVPNPEEQPASSLVYMIKEWMDLSENADSCFCLYKEKEFRDSLEKASANPEGSVLIGLTYALLDHIPWVEHPLPGIILMETGGMKGRKKERIREDIHAELKEGFGVSSVHSEYGMTELLSQSYSQKDGVFQTVPWKKILIRDLYDPLEWAGPGSTGAVSIIDLANLNSCSFIATADLGRMNNDGGFEVLGRIESSELRGCNLML